MNKQSTSILASFVTLKSLTETKTYQSSYQLLSEFIEYIIIEDSVYNFSAIAVSSSASCNSSGVGSSDGAISGTGCIEESISNKDSCLFCDVETAGVVAEATLVFAVCLDTCADFFSGIYSEPSSVYNVPSMESSSK